MGTSEQVEGQHIAASPEARPLSGKWADVRFGRDWPPSPDEWRAAQVALSDAAGTIMAFRDNEHFGAKWGAELRAELDRVIDASLAAIARSPTPKSDVAVPKGEVSVPSEASAPSTGEQP